MTTPNYVNRYRLGDLVHAVCTFVTTDGITPADPSMVMILLRDPAGNVSTTLYPVPGGISRAGVGAYTYDFTVNSVGSGFYRWVATGIVQAAEEWTFLVDRSAIL